MNIIIKDTKETQKRCPECIGQQAKLIGSKSGWNEVQFEDGSVKKLRSKSIEELMDENTPEQEERVDSEVSKIPEQEISQPSQDSSEIGEVVQVMTNRPHTKVTKPSSSFLQRISKPRSFQNRSTFSSSSSSLTLLSTNSNLSHSLSSYTKPGSTSFSSSLNKVTLPSNEEVRECISSNTPITSSTSSSSLNKKKKRRSNNMGRGEDGWFGMKGEEFTQDLKNDLKMIKLRGFLNPKKFYKRPDKFSKTLQV